MILNGKVREDSIGEQVSTILRPASGRSKKMWNQVWIKARGPLHRLISYGELIAEEL